VPGPLWLTYSPDFAGLRIGNFGDLLSPLLVAAFSGRPVRHVPYGSLRTRLVAIGTIGQRQRFGHSHVWGTGFGGQGDGFRIARGWRRPAFTRLSATALRGPFTAAMLRAEGIAAPAVFGDPALLLPRLWPGAEVEKRHELGVFLHESELIAASRDAVLLADFRPRPEFRRYEVPAGLGGIVALYHTVVPRSVAGMRAALDRLLRCRRVLSTGLHALVLAEAYGIPCAAFDIHAGPHAMVAPEDDSQPLDHRMRDFYAGLGAPRVPVFRTERHLPTDWEAAIRFIDTHWSPTAYDPAPLLSAFPKAFGTVGDMPVAEVSDALVGW